MENKGIFQVRVREAEACDLPDLLQLYCQLNNNSAKQLSLEQAENIFLRIGNYPDYCIYIAEHEGQVVGTFALMVMESLGHMGISSAILEDVVVSEQYRDLGVGQQMMSSATATAQQKGCNKLFFSSGMTRSDAHRFYENLGFKQHGYSYYLTF